METISNIAAAASKAIYGDQPKPQNETAGNEPISGEQGKGTVNDPYDQGNSANPISTSTHPTSNTISKTNDPTSSNTDSALPDRTMNSNTENAVGSHSHNHSSDPTGPHDSHLGNKADPRVDSDQIGSYGNSTGGGLTGNTTGGSSNPLSSNKPSSIPINPNNAAASGSVNPHQDTDKTGVVGGHGDPFKTTNSAATERSSNPGVVGGSDAGLAKQQGAANPTDDPSTGHEKSAVKKTKDDAEDFLKTKDPNDHSGEPMRMHTGSGDKSEDASLPKTQAERRESKVGNPGGQEHGKEVSEGTGEQWIKTSGMATDGGDFDATKPGAGREADRLMESKGIHKTQLGKPSEPVAETSSHSHGEKEKVPLGQKIKDKLHIGSKDK